MKSLRTGTLGLLMLFIVPCGSFAQEKPGNTGKIDFVGHALADIVTIQARVTGYLVEVGFREGAMVKKDDILFKIDPRPYEAQLKVAEAIVALEAAKFELAARSNARAKALAKIAGAISREEMDQRETEEKVALANLSLAKERMAVARLNLDWTAVRSPIEGKVGRSVLPAGNLVKKDDTKLATVVSQKPLRVYFNIDEASYLRMRNAFGDKRPVPIAMGLPGEEGYPYQGIIDFTDSRVSVSDKGEILASSVFPNAKTKQGENLLISGMRVRLRLTLP
jgi:RND family efflux transporter MFP subunit